MAGVGVAGVGAGAVAQAVETVKTEVYSIIANLISVLKVVLMYVYEWMMKFWSYFSEDPIRGVTLLANIYVFMS